MVDIFYFPTLPEMPFLEELADELEGIFHVIAHAGHENDLDYITESQKEIKDKYGPYVEHVASDVGYHIVTAYETLQELFDWNPTPEDIKRKCEECLYEHLIVGEPGQDYLDIFNEFYENNSC
jgi:hypothetical protein